MIKLQALDKVIRKLELEKKDIPTILEQSQQKITTEKQKLEDVKKILIDKQLEKKALELELATIEENIKKHNIELNSVKSNDRYKAIIEIVNNEKFKKSEVEDKILADFDDVDMITSNINKEKESLKNFEQEFETTKIELESKLATIDDEIQKIITDREVVLKNINDTSVVELYEKIRAHQNGQGLSEVDVETSSCSSCNMSLPFQKINDIMSSEQPVLCENCSKILYILKKENQ
jgi:hypothetical protein